MKPGLWARLGVFAACLAATACSGGSGSGEEEPRYDMRLYLRVSTEDSAHTRANGTWQEPYDTDTDFWFENRVRNVDVYLYDDAGKLLTRLEPVVDPTAEGPCDFAVGFNYQSGWLKIDADGNKTLSGRLVVVANSLLTGNVLDEVRFSRLVSSAPAGGSDLANTLIPMWGICTLTDIPVEPGVHYPTDGSRIEVSLLRAMAKITIRLDKEVRDDYELKEAALVGHCEYGNIVPTGAAGVVKTGELSVDGCFNPVEPGATTRYPLTVYECEETDLDGSKVQVENLIGYVPERTNPGNEEFYIDVTKVVSRKTGETIDAAGTSDGSGRYGDDFRIYFTKYADGQPSESPDDRYDVVRNHSYIFTIDDITVRKVSYTVCDWDDHDAGRIQFD